MDRKQNSILGRYIKSEHKVNEKWVSYAFGVETQRAEKVSTGRNCIGKDNHKSDHKQGSQYRTGMYTSIEISMFRTGLNTGHTSHTGQIQAIPAGIEKSFFFFFF